MITSERQLMSTQHKISMLRHNLENFGKVELPTAYAKLNAPEIQRLIDILEAEVSKYNATKHMRVAEIAIQSPDDLMLAPIRYRIAKGMTVEDFARFVNVAQRQIARYEALGYQNCSMPTFQKIMAKLQVKLEGRICAA